MDILKFFKIVFGLYPRRGHRLEDVMPEEDEPQILLKARGNIYAQQGKILTPSQRDALREKARPIREEAHALYVQKKPLAG
ncbi:MAG: hypothetical protein LBE06_00825 [Azoarcus sp.]|jgi:hypothetical protein|nr:hypothetical protein [Azoarcus sp.]